MVDQTYPKEGNTNTESQSQTNGLSLPVQYLCNLPEQHPRSTMDLFVKLKLPVVKPLPLNQICFLKIPIFV